MKKGFTLIELLAVIVILAIIALIAVPIVANIINGAKKSSQEESLKLYGKAVEQGVANYLMKHPTSKPETLTMDDIKDYVKYSGEKIDCEILQIGQKGNVYLSDCKVDNTKVEYEYGELIKPIVDLTEGLTPVVYDGNNWIVTDKNDPTWYDYDNQKWANAVVLRNDVTKTKGQTVTVEGETPEVLMMLVWIPRYEYKIEGQYGKHPDGTEGTEALPGEIKVNFILKNRTTPSEGYYINNAFTFDGEKNGFWVGKFEISHTTLSSVSSGNSLGCSTTNCAEAQYLRILPNVISLRYNNVSNFWYVIKTIENTASFGLTNMDTHMMKNSEWGAVAYLSQSKYGKYGNNDYEGAQKEVYINNSSYYYTGRSGGNPGGSTPINEIYTDQTSTTQNSRYGFYTYDGYLLDYDTNNKTTTKNMTKGPGASTTGNIYGVYDMSGGAYEHVMGAYGTNKNPTLGLSGFTSSDIFANEIINSKYYDIYANTTNSDSNDGNQSCNNGVCYGHGISEIKGSTAYYGWYGDLITMVKLSSSWFFRGGEWGGGTGVRAGVFNRRDGSGSSGDSISARFVGFVK